MYQCKPCNFLVIFPGKNFARILEEHETSQDHADTINGLFKGLEQKGWTAEAIKEAIKETMEMERRRELFLATFAKYGMIPDHLNGMFRDEEQKSLE